MTYYRGVVEAYGTAPGRGGIQRGKKRRSRVAASWGGATRSRVMCCEAETRTGDVLFVPCGWWHMVVNLEESIAFTENYVGDYNLRYVLRFLHASPRGITGLNGVDDDSESDAAERKRAEFYKKFSKALRKRFPSMSPLIDEENSVKPCSRVAPLLVSDTPFEF